MWLKKRAAKGQEYKWGPRDHSQDRPRTRLSSGTTNCSNSPEDGEVRAGKLLQRLK